VPALELSPETKPRSSDSNSVGRSTVGSQIRRHAELQPDHVAVVATGFAPLSYWELQRLIDEVRAGLRLVGFGRTARIVIAMRNGPQAALAIVAVACSAISIPLNPRQSLQEIERSLTALQPDGLLVAKGAESAARRAAERMGVAILEAIQSDDTTLGFRIATPETNVIAAPKESDEPNEETTALILQTSGTSTEPKLIPISHRIILAATDREQVCYQLTPLDRCLSVTPIWYAFGLLLPVLTPLLTGGSVAFPASALKVDLAEWLNALKPTWYSAAPALHLSILDQMESRAEKSCMHALRFLLTGGALIFPAVRDRLQSMLGVPLLDRYGASETQLISTNRPAPAPNKPGTCGIPWPDTVSIIGEDGREVAPGEQGEIFVGGSTVISGYLDAPALNRDSFVNGWFKTGDIGRLDEDGFLTLHGRKDDLINRGGEKISPVDIDDALMRHPAVAEAAAFSVPHHRLGEDVAAAVVLRRGMTASPVELREYLQERVASFKVPRRIVIREQLPRGQTGKVMRRRLAECLKEMTTAGAQIAAPELIEDTLINRNLVIRLAEIWGRLLKNAPLSHDEDFFENGGDSLLAMEMLVELEQLTGRTIPSAILFEAPTFGQLAQKLSEPEYLNQKSKILIRLNSSGTQPPLVVFRHSGYTEITLARLLGSDQPLLLVAPHGMDGEPIPPTIEATAADRLPIILDAQPEGPYRLCGHCIQGVVAFEVARLLVTAGKKVELVIMLDTPNINATRSLQLLFSTMRRARPLAGPIVEHATVWAWYQCARLRQFLNLPLAQRWAAIKRKLRNLAGDDVLQPPDEWLAKQAALLPNYSPKPLAVRVIYFSADYNAKDWRRISSDLELIKTPGAHTDLDLAYIAEHLRPRLQSKVTISSRTRAL
jgi:acyl-CoA synthetase (AMP-forming)/AMP-acid ligase II/thioesterase domain-containing protein/acyl carrier protein